MPRRSKVALVDTNVVLRFLLNDDADQSPRAQRLFMGTISGRAVLEIVDGVLAECVWVLEKAVQVPRMEIARQLIRLLSIPGVRTQGSTRTVVDALAGYGRSRCDIVDCLLDARARSRRARVTTFDATDFKRLACKWTEPG